MWHALELVPLLTLPPQFQEGLESNREGWWWGRGKEFFLILCLVTWYKKERIIQNDSVMQKKLTMRESKTSHWFPILLFIFDSSRRTLDSGGKEKKEKIKERKESAHSLKRAHETLPQVKKHC